MTSCFADDNCFADDDVGKFGELYNKMEYNHLSFRSYKINYAGYVFHDSQKNHKGSIKFQFSFKKELVDDTGYFFGYTQKSFWDIQDESEPFRENNYAPEMFKIFNMTNPDNYFSSLKYIQLGIKHESTGEDGNESHGWNTIYVEPIFILGNFSISSTIWLLFHAPDNEDILDYYGDGLLKITWFANKNNQHSLSFRKGRLSDKYAAMYQWDKTFGGYGNNIKIFLQLWSGYGEGLENYNVKNESAIFGVSF
jgi:phospholipase A1